MTVQASIPTVDAVCSCVHVLERYLANMVSTPIFKHLVGLLGTALGVALVGVGCAVMLALPFTRSDELGLCMAAFVFCTPPAVIQALLVMGVIRVSCGILHHVETRARKGWHICLRWVLHWFPSGAGPATCAAVPTEVLAIHAPQRFVTVGAITGAALAPLNLPGWLASSLVPDWWHSVMFIACGALCGALLGRHARQSHAQRQDMDISRERGVAGVSRLSANGEPRMRRQQAER